MFDDRQQPRFHPRSPVQEGQSPAPYFVLALVAAIFIWTAQQYGIADLRAYIRHVTARTPSAAAPARSPRGDIRAVFSNDDYPAAALAKGEQGTVEARLSIDETGRVSGCTILQSSGSRSLDDATCSILERRARFYPARDSQGRAIASSVVTPPVAWRLAS
jgi:TonB family protein